MCGILDTHWDRQQVVPICNGSHIPVLPDIMGTKQGALIYLTLFNVVVNNFIGTWLSMTVEDQSVDHDGLGETIGWFLGGLYANDGMVRSQDADWLQHSMYFLVVIL